MKKSISNHSSSTNHRRIVVTVREHKNDPTVSNRGYIVDGSQIRIRIQQIEKELVETRRSLYGNTRQTKQEE